MKRYKQLNWTDQIKYTKTINGKTYIVSGPQVISKGRPKHKSKLPQTKTRNGKTNRYMEWMNPRPKTRLKLYRKMIKRMMMKNITYWKMIM